jgi:hypothetical protein
LNACPARTVLHPVDFFTECSSSSHPSSETITSPPTPIRSRPKQLFEQVGM